MSTTIRSETTAQSSNADVSLDVADGANFKLSNLVLDIKQGELCKSVHDSFKKAKAMKKAKGAADNKANCITLHTNI